MTGKPLFLGVEELEKAYISLQDVYYVYREKVPVPRTALQGITSCIHPGDFLAVIGANGSGKSTLARHLNATLVPVSGIVRVGGMDSSEPENVWEIRSQVGMVFQNPDNQAVAATVAEDTAFGPENLGVAPEEVCRRVNSSLQQVGLEDMASRPPYTLSGGQKQLLAIAGVLAMEPRCIVLDEPAAMLDPKGRQQVMSVLHRLNRGKGVTIILVTHFMEEAVQAGRVWVMDRGVLALDGKAGEVFTREKELKSAGLDLPPARKLASRLQSMGFSLPDSKYILTLDDLFSCLTDVLNSKT